jgi:hypothetical protein
MSTESLAKARLEVIDGEAEEGGATSQRAVVRITLWSCTTLTDVALTSYWSQVW